MQVTVYTPESQLRSLSGLIASMWHDLLASRELAWRLMVRDIRARYRQSALGVLWAFLPPIATTLTFVFLSRAALINVGPTDIPYPAFVIFGSVFWQVFVESLNTPLRVMQSNKSMLSKINFPREALILSGIGQVFFDLGVRSLILAIVFVLYGLRPSWGLLLAPFAVLTIILLGIVIGLLLTPIGMLYNDISAALPFIINLWFFVTPVIYPQSETWPYSLLNQLNPVAPLLVGARDLATQGILPNAPPFLIISAVTLLGLLVMWVLYRVSLPILIERMSA